MNKEKIIGLFEEVLNDHGYEYEDNAVRKIVEESLNRKEHLIEMFRKHPKWDEDELCIHFDHDMERKTNMNAIDAFLYWLSREVDNQITKPAVEAEVKKQLDSGVKSWDIYVDSTAFNPLAKPIHKYTYEENRWGGEATLWDALYGLPGETILPDGEQMMEGEKKWYMKRLEWLNELDEKFNFRPGMKINRVLNKICVKMGFDKLEGYNAAFAQFSDGITPLKISRHTTISVNPVDFLLMSNGNSWRSCHYIGDEPSDAGCYSSGTISYMMGEDSFVVSIIDKEWQEDNIALAPKINRQVFGYNDHQLLQSRLYPQDCDSGANEMYRNLREMVEQIIADAEGETNRWVKDKYMNVDHNGTAYEDWECFNTCGQYSLRDHLLDESKNRIRMDDEPICIKCGERHGNTENIVCEDCGVDAYCADCGCHIDLSDEDSYIEYDGNYYCTDCRFWCAKCDYPERVRYSVWISDIEERWCTDCADRYAFQCDECGDYYSKRHTDCCDTVDGKIICENCLEADYVICADCGKAVRYDDAEMGKYDEYYCPDCIENNRKEEESA